MNDNATSQADQVVASAERIQKLNDIGIALSAERDANRLLETILLGAKELTNADAGTMYTVTEDHELKFEIIRTDSLGIAMGGTTGIPINFPNLPLYRDGEPNLKMIAAYAALREETVNLPDAYEAEGFDFAGTRAFDSKTGYRSKSFLTVPLKNHESEIIGVLQLINAKDPNTDEVRAFGPEDTQLAESLASQAAISLTNQKLITDLKLLFESFIQTIASAIDDKSPYTGGHCHRVPVLSDMLMRAVNDSDIGELKDVNLTEEQLYEMKIAAWLHDCGKVVTPEYVVDKSTKLETIYDRVHMVDTRFEVLKRDIEIKMLKRKLRAVQANTPEIIPQLEKEYKERAEALDSDREFIRTCNVGGEFMSDELKNRVKSIGARSWTGPDGKAQNFLSENEVYNLCISRGTITNEERDVINHHVTATLKMLNAIPFPKHLAKVAEIAGAHHEKLDGTGYPNGLVKDQMSIQARVLAIADVFEALTARDRPYKKGKPLSQALKILGFMKKDQHIDPDLFQVFIDQKVYQDYAEQYLGEEQIDEVIAEKIPGYEAVTSDSA
ncbi:MAG: GAF domain-containing protein [Magnetococcales bacterium]|nr:GAF domain-containing protein [Magnetococcales bacterium]